MSRSSKMVEGEFLKAFEECTSSLDVDDGMTFLEVVATTTISVDGFIHFMVCDDVRAECDISIASAVELEATTSL